MELSNSFIEELFKASLTDKRTMDILYKHLNYSNLPTEPYKIIWREIVDFYTLEEKMPTIGILSQSLENIKEKEQKLDCRHILANVKKAKVDNLHEELIKNFETYKKQVEFVSLYREVSDIYATNKDKAIQFMAKESERINNFNLKDGLYDRVFADFERRQNERLGRDPDSYDERISTGIHELDHYVRGGFKRGTSFLILGRSGTGKSTFLRWCAITAARLGKRVLLFSLEGLREETLEALDSAWTSTPLQDMEFGKLQSTKLKEIDKSLKGVLSSGGEIFVHNTEGFDSMTIQQARNTAEEIVKIYGPLDMILFDYLELFEVEGLRASKDGTGERRRRETIANKITDLGVEFRCVTGTATQATDISPNIYNNPEFVMTRTNISEFKGVIKPFSYFLTINQTDDEAEQEVTRLYCDKFRKHRAGQTIRMFQKMNINRFYDSHKTLRYLWDKESNNKKED